MPIDAATVSRDLLVHFRRQRPIRGGSLIVTMFGDSIMPRGGAVALASLIRLAGPFGLKERLVRTATARLAQDGWLDARRLGKLSEYRLSRTGRARFAEATTRIYSAPNTPWIGRWTLIVLPAKAALTAAARQCLRQELEWQGFGELSNGVFAHPEATPDHVTQLILATRSDTARLAGGTPLPPGALIFDASLADHLRPEALVNLGWDLADLGKRYQRFVRRFERTLNTLSPRFIEPKTAFILRTLLIHEYRRLHLRDPLLPERLLPAHWPGTRAAHLCREIYVRVFAPSELYLSQIGTRVRSALPPPDPNIMQRFGGLEPQSSGHCSSVATTLDKKALA